MFREDFQVWNELGGKIQTPRLPVCAQDTDAERSRVGFAGEGFGPPQKVGPDSAGLDPAGCAIGHSTHGPADSNECVRLSPRMPVDMACNQDDRKHEGRLAVSITLLLGLSSALPRATE
jgi:hypothetical protein